MGHLTGLKPGQVTRLERLYRRRVPVEKVISPELARSCTELSHEIRRQIGLLINRRGIIESVIIGTDRQLVIPELARSRSGPRLLRGVRFVHTHLNNQPLNKDDLTDLAMLRLDLMAVLGVGHGGEPISISLAHLVPPNPQGKAYEAWAPQSLQAFQCRCDQFVQSLEAEISRATPALRRTDDGPSALLVSVTAERRSDQEERLRECQGLATSQGIQVVGTVMQRLPRINPKYVLGVGKITEVIIHALQSGADLLIFDRDLTPAQIKALSEMVELKVIDRTQLILDIFASRAHSRAGKIQVELAQLKYLLPRLSQSSTAFSRLGGGIGARGPGETKLETDLRRVRDRIHHLERELKDLDRQREQQRPRRLRQGTPMVSIVGYTNAGKSTLLNTLTRSCVSARSRPFETLDTVKRRLRLHSGRHVILTDTVGFIRDLPQDLLEAFRTTLDELHQADVLVHVVDATAPDRDQQILVVEGLLRELDLQHVTRILVMNKCDQLPTEDVDVLERRFRACSERPSTSLTLRSGRTGGEAVGPERSRRALCVSALRKETLAPLRDAIAGALESGVPVAEAG
ncbi:MAG: GTPase HflX [Nitrospira sp. SB0675_bin_23]|nr:GTPase HflX [Nitrospira sp. SB0675_bin_23]